MKLLVLGGNGFVGQALLSLALKMGHDVSYISRHPGKGPLFEDHTSLTYIQGDLLAVEHIQLDQDYDWVIDLVGSITPKTMDALNIQARQGTVALAKTNQIPKVLYLSANVGYPSYLKSKRVGETIIQHSELSYVILRSGLIYGPGRPSSIATAHLVKMGMAIPLIGNLFKSIAPAPVTSVAQQILAALNSDAINLIGDIDSISGD